MPKSSVIKTAAIGLVVVLAAATPAAGQVTELEVPDGYPTLAPQRLNDTVPPTVAGYAIPPEFGGVSRSFTWRGGKATLLPLPAGLDVMKMEAVDVNDGGLVVGRLNLCNQRSNPDFCGSNRHRPFSSFAGTTSVLAVPDEAAHTRAEAVNDRGQIVGDTHLPHCDGHVWVGTSIVRGLFPPAGAEDCPLQMWDVNEAGQAVGEVTVEAVVGENAVRFTRAAYWDEAGNAQLLPPPPGGSTTSFYSYGLRLNDADPPLVVGIYDDPALSPRSSKLFTWSPGGDARELGPVAFGSPVGVNDAGDVVAQGTLYRDGEEISIQSLLPKGLGWNSVRALDVNDQGAILAHARVAGTVEQRYFVLERRGAGLDVDIDAYAPDGTPLEGIIAVSDAIELDVTITNTSDEELRSLTFAGGQPLVVDERSTGDVDIVSGPDPAVDPGLVLAPDESFVYRYELDAQSEGIAAAHTKVTARTEDGEPAEGSQSLRIDIGDGAAVTEALGRVVVLQAIDAYVLETYSRWYDAMAERGRKLFDSLSARLSPAQRLAWFGSEDGLVVSPIDRALAMLRGSSPEMVAASRPHGDLGNYTVGDFDRAYGDAFNKEIGNGVVEYVEHWKDVGRKARKLAKDSWREAMLTSFYVFGTASSSERAEFEAYATELLDGTGKSWNNLVNGAMREIPKWRENKTYFDKAVEDAIADALLWSPDIQAHMEQERRWRANLLDKAQDDPEAFARAWAKRDAEVANLVMPVILDTLIGGGVFKTSKTLNNLRVKGDGAAVMRSGQAAGVVKPSGAPVKGPKTAMDPPDAAARGAAAGDVAEVSASGGYLDDLDRATIVQSSDAGAVYELPNLGGVPETTLDAKAGILSSLESEYAAATGQQIQLAEVLKPSSALRKAGGVAKVELTAQKTGKPAMLDAGAPPEVLAEASVWRNRVHPRDLPGWDDLGKARQKAAVKEWNDANAAWAEYANPEPGSKTARLKQCIGQRSRVPLDNEPNKAGLQRFIIGEFEEVTVTRGTAEGKLIRVKHYEIEVVDTTRDNLVVNRKTVVSSAEALPQIPDADAVALAKVVGTDAAGKPILAPLSRSEKEFLMQRYVDKNIKARRGSGSRAISDVAEHGSTLNMFDAGASQAGKLLASHGVPFLPEGPGLAFLKRIAPFVAGKGATPAQIEKMYRQMVQMVRSQGGFGQHAVVVTRDSRYLGEVPFAAW